MTDSNRQQGQPIFTDGSARSNRAATMVGADDFYFCPLPILAGGEKIKVDGPISIALAPP